MTVTAVERCLGLIEALAGEPEPIELIEIARRVGLPNSAAHRTLATLVARRWVVQDPASQNYSLSLRLSVLAFRDLEARAVPDIVQTVLNKLALRTQEYCRLAIVEGEDLVWVARAQGATVGLRYEPDMGHELVLHATANGKAWLATMPENDALRIVYARGFEAVRPLGPKATRDIDELRRHLVETRARGYATAVEEAEAGTAAVAVAFYGDETEQAKVAGTISVAGPMVRIGPDRLDELSAALRAAAREITALWPLRNRQKSAPMPRAAARDLEPA